MGNLSLKFNAGLIQLTDVTSKEDLSQKLQSALAGQGAKVDANGLKAIFDVYALNRGKGALDCSHVPLTSLVDGSQLKLWAPPSKPGTLKSEAAPKVAKLPSMPDTAASFTSALESHKTKLGEALHTSGAALTGVLVPNAIDPAASMTAKVLTNLPPEASVVSQGAATLQAQAWPGPEKGFTLLVDVRHNDQKVANEWTHLEIGVPYQNNGVTQLASLRIAWPEQQFVSDASWTFKPSKDCLQPTNHHTQVAINISEKDLLKEFPWVTSAHQIAVRPVFSKPTERAFHSTIPTMISLPISVKPTAEDARQTFDIVPITLSLPLSSGAVTTLKTYVAPGTKVTTSMETETEYTVKSEAQILSVISNAEKLASSPDLLEKVLGKGWKMERVHKYDMVKPDGSFALNPNTKTPWTQKDCDAFGVGKKRPELTKLGIAQPGIIRDRYLVEEDGRVLRTRSNAIEANLLAAKGFSTRSEDGTMMRRYTKQVPLKKDPIGDFSAEKLVNHPELNFGEVIKEGGEALKLPPAEILVVDSERYRYKLVFEGTVPATEIELSADISTGKIGKKSTTSYGFEFGLGHLGTSAGITPASSLKVEDAPKDSKLEASAESFAPVKPRNHDRQDLSHPKILKGESVDIFQHAVKAMTKFIAEGMDLTLAGEKARVMRETLR
jgi:hypothetical protein